MTFKKNTFLFAFFFLSALSFNVVAQEQAQVKEPQILTIYTYDSFAAEWGPGPKIKNLFEQECDCELEFVVAGDGQGILQRILLEGEHTQADIALGFDASTMASFKQRDLFVADITTKNDQQRQRRMPLEWQDTQFAPYDYGYFSFIYDDQRTTKIPKSFSELLELAEQETFNIVIQDPRTSTPGLGLLLWIKAVFGDDAKAAWQKLKPSILTVTPSWSQAYNMFLSNEADLVLSYSTSPAYHKIAENKDQYRAMTFTEGHYIQIELAGVLASSHQIELSKKFVSFLGSPQAQYIIAMNNWMLAVNETEPQLPDAFREQTTPENTLMISAQEIQKNKQHWLNEYLEGMSQ